jgi:hypothetical protein
MSYPFNCI